VTHVESNSVFGVFVLETKEFDNVWISVLLIGTDSVLRAEFAGFGEHVRLVLRKSHALVEQDAIWRLSYRALQPPQRISSW
jgi:hypothetical protein